MEARCVRVLSVFGPRPFYFALGKRGLNQDQEQSANEVLQQRAKPEARRPGSLDLVGGKEVIGHGPFFPTAPWGYLSAETPPE